MRYLVNGTRSVPTTLSQNVADDVSVDICETEISTLETVDEFFVVNPEEVQHRGVEIVDMHDIFNRIIS